MLGVSIRVAQQSYARWTPSRQARIDHLMQTVQNLGDRPTESDERWLQQSPPGELPLISEKPVKHGCRGLAKAKFCRKKSHFGHTRWPESCK